MHACLSWPAADRFCTIELTEPQVVKRETIELSTDENGLLTYTVTGNLTEAPFEVLCTPGLRGHGDGVRRQVVAALLPSRLGGTCWLANAPAVH
jgi:hypothetical protein